MRKVPQDSLALVEVVSCINLGFLTMGYDLYLNVNIPITLKLLFPDTWIL